VLKTRRGSSSRRAIRRSRHSIGVVWSAMKMVQSSASRSETCLLQYRRSTIILLLIIITIPAVLGEGSIVS